MRFGREAVAEALDHHPELRNDPEFMIVANRVREETGDVAIRVTADQGRYLIGEPMLFRVSVHNASSRTVHVPGWDAWGASYSDDFLGYLEVEDPKGDRQLRAPLVNLWTHSVFSSEYSGTPLVPGDSVVFSWQPAVTLRVQKAGIRQGTDWGLTFRETGEYRVRVGYVSPDYWWRLSCRGRPILSRPLTVRMEAPDAGEAIILDALRPTLYSSIGSLSDDEFDRLNTVLLSNPTHPLSMHVRWALARSGQNFRSNDRWGLLLDAFDMATGLWKEELAAQIVWRGKDDATGRVSAWLLTLMERKPGLWTDHWYTLAALRADPEVGDATRAASYWWTKRYRDGARVPSWEELRKAGIPQPRPPRKSTP